MLNRFYALTSAQKIAVVTAGILILLVISSTFFLLRKAPPAAEPPLTIEYCGATPQELCILSFGRDGSENSIINFFVPKRNFPDFYLIIMEAGMERRYTCGRNVEIKTSVLCSGDPLSLKRTVEINLMASEDNRLLATGRFFIEAFLVSTRNSATLLAAGTGTSSSSTRQPTRTPTKRGTATTGTPTAVTSGTAYPNPSAYP